MPDNTSISKSTMALSSISLLAALLLALVNLATAERIQEQQLAIERKALSAVFPPDLHDNDLLEFAFTLLPGDRRFEDSELLGLTSERSAYLAYHSDTFAGAILPVEAHDGYSGDIVILVGILANGQVAGVRVLEHRETPGLGDKIDISISDWILGFNGKSLDNPPPNGWQVLKDSGEFEGLVGATVTPRAVINGLRKALIFFERNSQQLLTMDTR